MSKSKEKNILCYCLNLSGGAGINMVRIASAFTLDQHKVSLAYGIKTSKCIKNISKDVNIINLKTKRSILSILKLRAIIKDHKPDIIFTTGGTNGAIAAFSMFFSKTSAKLIIREANAPSSLIRDKPIYYRYIKRILFIYAYTKASRIIAITKEMEKELIKLWNVVEGKLTVIYNGIDTNNSNEILYRKKNNKNINILTVGRLVLQKRQENLILATKTLSENYNINLTIVGDGTRKEYLQKVAKESGISDKVNFAGYTEDPSIYYRNSDIFVLSSQFEGFPNVILEALYWGLPVVSTNCPTGPEEIINHMEHGYLVPVGDVKGLVEGIEFVINNEWDTNTLKSRANYFSLDKQLKKFRNLAQK